MRLLLIGSTHAVDGVRGGNASPQSLFLGGWLAAPRGHPAASQPPKSRFLEGLRPSKSPENRRPRKSCHVDASVRLLYPKADHLLQASSRRQQCIACTAAHPMRQSARGTAGRSEGECPPRLISLWSRCGGIAAAP